LWIGRGVVQKRCRDICVEAVEREGRVYRLGLVAGGRGKRSPGIERVLEQRTWGVEGRQGLGEGEGGVAVLGRLCDGVGGVAGQRGRRKKRVGNGEASSWERTPRPCRGIFPP
jgi:hypothetical protein